MKKLCRRCQIEKDTTEFSVGRAICKACRSTEQSKIYGETYSTEERNARREYQKAYRESSNAEAIRFTKIKTAYGIDRDFYDYLIQSQNNSCAICKKPFTNTPHIDHGHTTGKVRGLLCGLCNIGIGTFFDNINLLQNAIEYLKR
jgi:hypothetical protein